MKFVTTVVATVLLVSSAALATSDSLVKQFVRGNWAPTQIQKVTEGEFVQVALRTGLLREGDDLRPAIKVFREVQSSMLETRGSNTRRFSQTRPVVREGVRVSFPTSDAALTEMDAGVGKILDALESMSLTTDTLVFFVSDNGMNMGHHGIYGKGNGTFPLNMYDTSVRVPAIAYRPGNVPAGVIRDDLVGQYDVYPTLLDYLGIGDGTHDATSSNEEGVPDNRPGCHPGH